MSHSKTTDLNNLFVVNTEMVKVYHWKNNCKFVLTFFLLLIAPPLGLFCYVLNNSYFCEMNTGDIQRYKNKSVPKLLEIAQKHFNTYIRLRDSDENGNGFCISSGKPLKVPSMNAHAGHFYPAGHYPLLRFNEDNVHLQSKSDNYFKHSNALEYRKNLLKKIGQERLDKLEQIAANPLNKVGHKWDRFTLIEIIVTYKEKCKDLLRQKND